MEELLVFPVRAAPDATLLRVREALQGQGFRTRSGGTYDVVARRGAHRVFVGLAPHPRGLAARVKCKSLLPGTAGRLLDEVAALLTQRLGIPLARTDTPGESA